MFIIFNKNIFLIIFISIVFVSASDDQQSKSDNICRETRNILCVKDVLMVIATVVKSINRTVNEIEKTILNKIKIIDTLNRYVNFEMGLIHSNLPTPQYHVEFFKLNNIDKKYLGDLFLEAHYAMSYYYNSIDDILNMNDPFALTTDAWFRQIEYNLRNQIICQYRSILHVYSYDWPLINQINRIQFSKRKYRDAPSLAHEVHAIIITRLLREWMQRIHSVIINLEGKFQ